MKAVYRVNTVVIYPDGHPVKENARTKAGQYWQEREHCVTKWDIVLAHGCEEACGATRSLYESQGLIVKRIYSCNHLGDVSIEATA